MEFGYAIVEKDAEGFERFFFNGINDKANTENRVWAREKDANEELAKIKEDITDVLAYGLKTSVERRHLLFWKRVIIERISMKPDVYRRYEVLLNSLRVKRIRIA